MKVFLDTVGCRLNQSEIESFANQFRTAGHEIVDTPSGADLVVVNTCTVTKEAASDSRQKIRQAFRAGVPSIAATGCWASLEPQNATLLPGVKHVIPNTEKDGLVRQILGPAAEGFELEPLARTPLPGIHLRTRAFIKAQDGCNNHCTFCITTIARGPSASRTPAEILADIRHAADGGVKEIVLTGVHLGSWGKDFPQSQKLVDLLRLILKETDIPRIRLSSLEPWDLDEEFFSLWQDPRLCRHLHLPLQTGSGRTLRRMARNTTPEKYDRLVEMARWAIPGLALTTDIIVGFPGETPSDFDDSLEFVRKIQFAGGHVFPYSERAGTAAANFPDAVPPAERKVRGARMRAVLAETGENYRSGFVNQVIPVLWESTTGLDPQGWHLSGLTDNYLRVTSRDAEKRWNQITPVMLTGLSGEGMSGEIVPSGS